MTENNCVQWTQDRVIVNNQGCLEGDYCSFAGVRDAIRTANLTMDQGMVACAHNYKFEPNPAYVVTGNLECWLKDANDRLMEGASPKQCSKLGWEDESCRLVNNHMSECVCGLDGNFYCALSDADPVLESYWRLCEAAYISEARQAYWAVLREYYVLFSVRVT